MAITRTAIVNDDGTGTTGTVIENAWKQELYDQIDAAVSAVSGGTPGTSVVTTTGNIAALPLPSGSGPLFIAMNNATLATILGIAPGIDGQHLTIRSKGAGQVDFSHQDAGASGAAYKLILFATSYKTSLYPSVGVLHLVYDGTAARWVLVSHEQGAWIDYSATSTVSGFSSFAGKVVKYYLKGRTLSIVWRLNGTSNSTAKSFTVPFTYNGSYSFIGGRNQDNSADLTTAPRVDTADVSGTVTLYTTLAAGGFTASGTTITNGGFTQDVN